MHPPRGESYPHHHHLDVSSSHGLHTGGELDAIHGDGGPHVQRVAQVVRVHLASRVQQDGQHAVDGTRTYQTGRQHQVTTAGAEVVQG